MILEENHTITIYFQFTILGSQQANYTKNHIHILEFQ